MGKKLSILLVSKFHEFSFGKTKILIGFHLLNLWAFAVSFPNGGSIRSDDGCDTSFSINTWAKNEC